MCVHPAVLHELNWVPRASNPDLTRAKLPSRGISLSIDYREASATVSCLHSDEVFFPLAPFLRVEVCCASGHISLAEHPSWRWICRFGEKAPYLSMAQQPACRVWTQLTCMLRGERLHAARGDGNNERIQNANKPKLTPTALSGRYDAKPQEKGIAFWAMQLPNSPTSQAGSQTTYMLLVTPPSTNIPLIIVPAVGRDAGVQQRNNNQDEHRGCALTHNLRRLLG